MHAVVLTSVSIHAHWTAAAMFLRTFMFGWLDGHSIASDRMFYSVQRVLCFEVLPFLAAPHVFPFPFYTICAPFLRFCS